ncbi:MAG: FAD-binding oxidoreductase [Chloroflexi bacterium]|nr:FAD-binding oxidoreductase [Chloroflexota bacterium]
MRTFTRRDFLRGTAAAAATIALGLTAGLGASEASAQAASPGINGGDTASGLTELSGLLTGTLLLPTDAGYDPASTPANGRYRNIRPIAVAQVADEADIVTCVNWCRRMGVAPVARAGGHSYAGFSTTTGLLIDISKLNSFSVDPHAGTATSGGAALNADLFRATADTPLFLPGGTCLGVGLGGLTLGGGIGYNTHWAGLTSDHLLATRIVTASGQVLDLDPSANSDLFWACRGGAGGSFGINTSFTYELVPVPMQNISYYRFDYRGADAAAAVLNTFHTILQSAPAALNAVAMAQASPVGAGGPREAIDVMSRGQYVGPVDELRDLVSPLLRVATPTKTALQAKTFWDTQRIWVTEEPPVHSFGDISRYAPAPIPDSVVQQLVELLVNCPSRTDNSNGAIWSLGWIGGDVVNAIGRTDTAYVHRNMLTLLRPTPVWEDNDPPSVGDGLIAWTQEAIDAIAPYTPNESYQNFPNRAIDDWQTAYFAENLERLIDVKTKYDPTNLFANPQSIPVRLPVPVQVPVSRT